MSNRRLPSSWSLLLQGAPGRCWHAPLGLGWIRWHCSSRSSPPGPNYATLPRSCSISVTCEQQPPLAPLPKVLLLGFQRMERGALAAVSM